MMRRRHVLKLMTAALAITVPARARAVEPPRFGQVGRPTAGPPLRYGGRMAFLPDHSALICAYHELLVRPGAPVPLLHAWPLDGAPPRARLAFAGEREVGVAARALDAAAGLALHVLEGYGESIVILSRLSTGAVACRVTLPREDPAIVDAAAIAPDGAQFALTLVGERALARRYTSAGERAGPDIALPLEVRDVAYGEGGAALSVASGRRSAVQHRGRPPTWRSAGRIAVRRLSGSSAWRTLWAGGSVVRSLTVSPDGRRCVLPDDRVVDVATGRTIARLPAAARGAISGDGNAVLVFADGGLAVYDLRRARLLPGRFAADGPYPGEALSHDAGLLAMQREPGLRVFDVASRRELARFVAWRDGEHMALFADGHFTVSEGALARVPLVDDAGARVAPSPEVLAAYGRGRPIAEVRAALARGAPSRLPELF